MRLKDRMSARSILQVACFGLVIAFGLSSQLAKTARGDSPPNIVYIMSDELAYFELSHVGNQKIHTPRIDQMAREGLRFTHAYAGAPVCAPLRCNLMTGKHAGHASVRANDGGTPLRAEEETIASLLKEKGYATGGYGKWGCGGRDSTGAPEDHGFDEFFGYYDQVHAHSFYPPYLIRNSEEVVLEGNAGGRAGQTYSHYEIMERGLNFIRENKDRPFFCYLPITPPHGMYDIPADDPAWELYKEDEWVQDPSVAQDIKNYAAMVSMVDRNVGEVIDLLEELELDDNTIVFFTGDNGGQDRFKSRDYPRGYFGPNVNPIDGVEFRGGKGNLYEGGLRIPFIVRWPGKIEAGQESNLVFYQPDVLPTLSELAGARTPDDVDGMSILPEILGADAVGREQSPHEFLYWEFGNQVAVRKGDWKIIRPGKDQDWALYDVSVDLSEANNIASQHPEVVAELAAHAEASHEDAKPGTYLDTSRTRHERDRWAKWGTTRQQSNNNTGRRVHRISGEGLIPSDQLTLIGSSSENRANDRLAAYAIDGKPHTVWHTNFSDGVAKHPHELTIDLGETYKISGFRYLARQDGGWNGAFGETEIYVSSSADQFGEPVLTTTFAKERQAQAADLEEAIEGRYVKVRILTEVNGGPWASAADFAIVGTPSEDQEAQAKLDALLNEFLDSKNFPGVSAAVVLSNGRVIAAAAGQNSKEDDLDMSTTDVLFSGSIGKTYFAAMALHLQASGRLNIDDKVTDYLGQTEWITKIPNYEALTIRHLMQHRSGIPRYVFGDAFWEFVIENPDHEWKNGEQLEYVFGAEPVHEADKDWAYSDTNYILLGVILESVTGEKAYDYIERELLKPLELQHTHPTNSRVVPNLAQGYTAMFRRFGLDELMVQDGKYVINPAFEWCGGGYASTTSDLAVWTHRYFSGKAFEGDYLESMLSNPSSTGGMLGPGSEYGLGVILRDSDYGPMRGHDGVMPGYLSATAYFPELDMSVAIQFNTDNGRDIGAAPASFLPQIAKALTE